MRSPEQSCACDAGACVGAGTGGLIGGLVADDVEGGVVEGRGVVGAAVDGGVAAVGAAVGAAVDGALVTAVGARVSQMLSGQFTRWPPGSSRATAGADLKWPPNFGHNIGLQAAISIRCPWSPSRACHSHRTVPATAQHSHSIRCPWSPSRAHLTAYAVGWGGNAGEMVQNDVEIAVHQSSHSQPESSPQPSGSSQQILPHSTELGVVRYGNSAGQSPSGTAPPRRGRCPRASRRGVIGARVLRRGRTERQQVG